jgi:hypothetical protein
VGRRIRRLKISWKVLMVFGGTTTAASGVDPAGSVLGDFPLAWGCSRSKASWGVGAAARHRQRCGAFVLVELQMVRCVIFFLLGAFL